MNTESSYGLTKEQILSPTHPIGHKLREIPEVIFPEEMDRLPEDAVALKRLFRREEMDAWHVDALVLKKIAGNLLDLLKRLGEIPVYPGLLGLESILVDLMDSRCPVYLIYPDMFQLLDLEQEFEWFPEDERLFSDVALFDSESQLAVYNRLVYRILIASSKGNVKLPPARVDTDYSHLFYQVLPECWKEDWMAGKILSIPEMEERLTEEIAEEKHAEAKARNRIKEKAAKAGAGDQPEAEEPGKNPDMAWEDLPLTGDRHILFVVLRTDLKCARDTSRMVYMLLEEEERECMLEKKRPVISFIYGDGAVCVRDFTSYAPGFRVQFSPEIRACYAGELLTVAADQLEDLRGRLPSQEDQIRVYLVLDGRLANDTLFRFAIKRMEEEREKSRAADRPEIVLHLRYSGEIYCEAAAELERLSDSSERM